MRGRLPSGPECVNKLTGDAVAKERLQVVLETLAGTRRVNDACTRLNISEQRFEQLRREALQSALAALTPKPTGRRPRVASPEQVRWEQAQARIAALETQLRIAAARTEVATILPHTAAAEAKKAFPRR